MPAEDEMTIDERWKYLRKMRKRYVKANRNERGRLLDEMEAVTGLHRKSLIRLMDSELERKVRCTERGESYGPEVDDALRVIAESLDYICAERLTPNLVWMALHLAAHGEMVASPSVLDQLSSISVSRARQFYTARGRLLLAQKLKNVIILQASGLHRVDCNKAHRPVPKAINDSAYAPFVSQVVRALAAI